MFKYYALTDSGCMTTELWKQILPRFNEHVEAVYGSKFSVLLLDNLKIHKNIDAAGVLLKKNLMELLYFPPNSTHLFQPLDNRIFALFKMDLYLNIHRLDQALLTQDIVLFNKKTDLVLYGCAPAEANAFSRDTIVQSFKNTHIYPFDERKILAYSTVSVVHPPPLR